MSEDAAPPTPSPASAGAISDPTALSFRLTGGELVKLYHSDGALALVNAQALLGDAVRAINAALIPGIRALELLARHHPDLYAKAMEPITFTVGELRARGKLPAMPSSSPTEPK